LPAALEQCTGTALPIASLVAALPLGIQRARIPHQIAVQDSRIRRFTVREQQTCEPVRRRPFQATVAILERRDPGIVHLPTDQHLACIQRAGARQRPDLRRPMQLSSDNISRALRSVGLGPGARCVVDSYLRAANIKRRRVSNHALRHTSATLAYRYTRDLRAVQDMLGH
jgi:hypothetical protein